MPEPSSLASTSKSVVSPGDESDATPSPAQSDLGPCPRVTDPRKVYQRGNPLRWFWAPCQAWECARCGPRRVQQRAGVVGWSASQHDRQRFILLTDVPEDWQACRQKVRTFVMDIRSSGTVCELAWVREPNPKGTGIHIHAVQWGDYMRQDILQNLWGAIVDIREVKHDPTTVAGYISKGAGRVSNYMTKEARANYAEWLALNGGRPLHWTRAYHGQGGYPAAQKALQEAKRAAGAPEWVACKGDPPRMSALRALEEAEWRAEALREQGSWRDLALEGLCGSEH